MATFLQDSKLNSEIENIFETAEINLALISPFIKLHGRLKDILKDKKSQDKVQIIIVFGKNEENIAKSFSNDEFEFLKEFPNLQIRYEPRLHARYYANESAAILSSMNLYDYSQNNNIEFGILTKTSMFGNIASNFTENLDIDAFNYFNRVIDNSEILYERKPKYEDKMFGISKKFVEAETTIDKLSEKLKQKTISKKNSSKKSHSLSDDGKIGYCIRTGEEIPFNPEKPLSQKAFKQWNKYGDRDYSEKYCHYSGEPSKGDTTVAKPILRKNWKKATN